MDLDPYQYQYDAEKAAKEMGKVASPTAVALMLVAHIFVIGSLTILALWSESPILQGLLLGLFLWVCWMALFHKLVSAAPTESD